MTERLETVIKLIEDVQETLRTYQNNEFPEEFSAYDAGINVQKLHSVKELIKMEFTAGATEGLI